MSSAVLSLSGVSRVFPGPPPRTVLRDIDFALAPGEYLAIMGESGVGKSTLLNLMAGLDRPDAGRVRIDGMDLAGLDDATATRLRRRQLGFVFQAFHVLPHLNVAQNVALPLLLNGVTRAEARDRVADMLAAMGLAGRASSLPRELSGGETQRVAIARALVHRPRLILADEPTGNLDSATEDRIFQLFKQLNREGKTIIFVTHSKDLAKKANRRITIRDGRVAS